MADQRKGGIAWTDETWNPVTGCTKVSNGCKFCYAERLFPRVYGRDTIVIPTDMGGITNADGIFEPLVLRHRPRKFTDVRLHPERLDQPLRWRRPRKIFVNSMSDLFHPDVPFEFQCSVFAVMALSPQHTFQILTKRPKEMLNFFMRVSLVDAGEELYQAAGKAWPLPNAHLLVSVEDQPTAEERIPILMRCPAAVRGVSAEPLLGAIDFGFMAQFEHEDNEGRGVEAIKGLDWIIVGCESGPKRRHMELAWVRSIKSQCKAAGVPLMVKQLSTGSGLLGAKNKVVKDLSQFPEDLRIQEYPTQEVK